MSTIATIGPAERQRVLERLLASHVYAIRQLVVAFKALGSMLYAQSAEARAVMTTPRARRADSGLIAIRRSSRGIAARGGEAHEHAAE